MSEPFIGEVILVGWNFAARGYALTEGQLLPIAQNTALFSLIGTVYGGDGRTTFGLPDLRGRVPMGQGRGPGLSNRTWGQRGGLETTVLTANNVPPHSHPVKASKEVADLPGPGTDFLAKAPDGGQDMYHNGPGNRTMDPGMIANPTNRNDPFNNVQPFLAMYYQIALVGIFPSRS
ncbi:MAG: tail fiber protein [Litorimonas sp.]